MLIVICTLASTAAFGLAVWLGSLWLGKALVSDK